MTGDGASFPVLEVDALVKDYGSVRALHGVSFEAVAGEILVIMGGSGCGKTTTLRCIAGLEDVTGGTIKINGAVVASGGRSEPPERRGVGMVFQSYALWPHKTALENVSYGLERRGLAKSEAREKARAALAQVGLDQLAERLPSLLSGGQQQRVAIARAAATSPKLLLLDEPLSNLDAKLRERMREDLRDMIKTLGVTAVHITHDQAEAMALADRVVCMRDGRVEQTGTPKELYRRPRNAFVADFLGACSFTSATLVSTPDGLALEIAPGLRVAPQGLAGRAGDSVAIGLRPDAALVDPPESTQTVPARIVKAVYLGAITEYHLDVSGVVLRAHSRSDRDIGAVCRLGLDPAGVLLF